ncbi:MAG: hypothetical protein LBQ10_09460 [Desulfovibrio sp.]|jgi:hypothetical protein|nr:hypothetical protein [Desulfovibrio sp.]
MSARRLSSTPKSQIQSLSCQGTRVAEHYYQIKELVRSRLGDEYALLFAEPGGLRQGEVVDWYSPLQGPAKPVTELPEDEARKVAALAEQMARSIKRLADDLKGSGASQANVLRGMMLELALRYPDPSCIYAVGGQPVMTCWGFSSSTKGAQPEDLARFGERFSPAQAAPAPSVQPPRQERADARRTLPGWLWLLPLLLLLLLLLVIFVPFGSWRPIVALPGLDFRLPPLPWASARDAQAELQALQAEENGLQADIDGLRGELSAQAALCLPGQRDASPKTAPRQDLVIPEKTDDYAFLLGQWMNDAGLVSRLDGQPITVLYSFDSSGNGTVTVRQAGKRDCVGKARARFTSPGVLQIEAENQMCPGENKSYKAEVIECRQTAGGQTSCLGRSADGASWGGNVYFRRIP